MVENKKKQETAPFGGISQKTILLAVVALLFGAAAYGMWKGAQAPALPPQSNSTVQQIDSPAAKLLLSAYENGGKMDVYYLKYMMNDSGAESGYEVGSNGSDQWVVLSGDFGAVEGYFGKNGTKDLVCLNYDDVKKCARIKDDSQTSNIANTLKSYLPNEKIYGEQENFVKKLITAGAIRFVGSVAAEKSGEFDAEKVAYTLSYKNMTVDKLLELGISPNSPEVVSRSNQKITMWVDKQTGLVVRSLATYRENGVDFAYETKYYEISLTAPTVPTPAVGVVDADAFAQFYQSSMEDYGANQLCLAQGGEAKDLCLKNLGVENGNWGVCAKISDKKIYEQCTLIVAQNTNNPVLCENLTLYPDDCYIAIASGTGNFELCKKLKNASLAGNCNEAAADGVRKLAAENERLRRLAESRNCALDSDCQMSGNANQYCVPKNSTRTFANETSPLYACLKDVPCGCADGFCGFKKNDTYYRCISEVETGLTEAFIQEIIAQANGTNSSE